MFHNKGPLDTEEGLRKDTEPSTMWKYLRQEGRERKGEKHEETVGTREKKEMN